MREDYHLEELKSYSHLKPIRIIYWSHWLTDKTEPKNRHIHAYWQMEFILKGSLKIKFEKQEYKLEAGTSIIIPPFTWHESIYKEGVKRETWSIKFDVENMREKHPLFIIENDNSFQSQVTNMLLKKITSMKSNFTKCAPLTECLLSTLLESIYDYENAYSEYSNILKKVNEIINNSDGQRLKVEQIARQIGYSKDHLSSLLKKETGVSLKTYIDMELLKKAQEMLHYSDLNISEVAEKLGFADIYSFSHFFKRVSGISPRAFITKSKASPKIVIF